MIFKYRAGGEWNNPTRKIKRGGEWVPIGGGGVSVPIPEGATIVSIDGGTVTGETADGAQYTDSSLHSVLEDISADVDGAIAIQSGEYPWTGMLQPSDNTNIIGDGVVNINIQSIGGNPVVDFHPVRENVSFQNLIFNSDGSTDDAMSRSDIGIRKDNILINGCEFHNFDGRSSGVSDVHVINADNWYGSVIENCLFTGVGYSAIRIHAAGESMICRNNTIHLPTEAQMAIMSDAHDSVITGNYITLGDASGDPSHAIRLQDRWAEYDKEIWIEGNTIEADPSSTDSNGVRVAGSRFVTLDIADNNTFYGLNQGVSGNLQSGTNITGNTFDTCNVAISSSDSTNINISDNTFIDCDEDVVL